MLGDSHYDKGSVRISQIPFKKAHFHFFVVFWARQTVLTISVLSCGLQYSNSGPNRYLAGLTLSEPYFEVPRKRRAWEACTAMGLRIRASRDTPCQVPKRNFVAIVFAALRLVGTGEQGRIDRYRVRRCFAETCLPGTHFCPLRLVRSCDTSRPHYHQFEQQQQH